MKRNVTFIAVLAYIMILLLYFKWWLLIPVVVVMIYYIKPNYQLLGLVILGLILVSFVYHHNNHKSYINETYTVGEIVRYGSDYQLKVGKHKVLIKNDMEEELSGVYKIHYTPYVYFYNNPNSFNYELYLLSLGFDDVIKQSESVFVPIKISYKVNYLQQVIKKLSVSEFSAYYKAILFADKSDLDQEVFQINGTSHILAISGLHIGLIYGAVYLSLFMFKKYRKLVACMVVIIYVILINHPISAVRACLMIVLSLLATYKCRKYDLLQTLGFIALLFMIYNPFVVFHTGFQYSFVAVITIEIFYNGVFRKMKSKLFGIMILPLVIQIAMLPLTLYHQNSIHLLSFVANILSVFFISWVLYGLLIYMIVPIPILLEFTDFLFAIILKLNEAIASQEFFILESPSPPLILVILFYCIAILIREKRLRKLLLYLSGVIVMCLLIYHSIVIEVYFLDVGQGDAILIKKGFNSLMIDGGKSSEDAPLKEILLKQGIMNIDVMMLSHSDMDHLGGLIDINAMTQASTLLYKEPNQIKENFNHLVYSHNLACNGETVDLNFLKFESIYYPSQNTNNNASLIGYLTLYETTLFVSGDIETSVEELLKLKDVDILKVPHHGSKTSSTERFLDQLKPEVAVICVGKNNYGHPHQGVLDRYDVLGTDVYKTIDGCVKFYVLPFNIYFVKTFN